MIIYDKQKIRQSLTLENVYDLLSEWGGEPQLIPTGILSRTICHHVSGSEGNYKLYYYSNSDLFQCYSNCGFFDIF